MKLKSIVTETYETENHRITATHTRSDTDVFTDLKYGLEAAKGFV